MKPVIPPVTSGSKDTITAEKFKRVFFVSGIVILVLSLLAAMFLYYFAKKDVKDPLDNMSSVDHLLEGYNYAVESDNFFVDPDTGDTFIYGDSIKLSLTDIIKMDTYTSYNEDYKYRLFTIGGGMDLNWKTLFLLVEVKDKNNELGLLYPYDYLEFNPLMDVREINNVVVNDNILTLDVTEVFIDEVEGTPYEDKVTYGLEVLEDGLLRKYKVK